MVRVEPDRWLASASTLPTSRTKGSLTQSYRGSLALLLLVGLALAVPAGAQADGLTASFAKTSDWGSGFVGSYTIRNGGSAAVNGWRLDFDLPPGESITGAWNGLLNWSTNHYVLTDESWTHAVAPGSSVTVGFQGGYSGAFVLPANCVVNGQPCAGGGSSPPPPSPPPPSPPPPSPPPPSPPPPPPPPPPPSPPPPDTTPPSAPSGLTASFAKTSDWGSGFVGSYTIRNGGSAGVNGWRLEFDLAAGESITGAWSGNVDSSGNHYVLTDAPWTHTVAPGSSVTVGFQGGYSGAFVLPANCVVNGQPCAGGGSSPPPPSPPPPPPPPPPDTTPPSAPGGGGGGGSGATPAEFAPYVDMTLWPQLDLGQAVGAAGIRHFTLGFIVSGSPCQAAWGGVVALNDPFVTNSLSNLRAAGGNAIISFGGAANQELALTCTGVDALAGQYQAVIDQYGIRDLDFDVEGAAQGDQASLDRRSKALAAVQAAGRAAGRPVHVSLTLPVMPTGLTADGLNVIRSAIANGLDVGAVNVMAMDYFDPSLGYSGLMGDYAIQAAQSTHDQLAALYPGRGDASLWAMVGVTPMIGVNDDSNEIFTVADATKLATFAQSKGLGRLAMWSANRDAPCPGPTLWASNTCSGVAQSQWAFSRAFETFGV
jgi:hypothetical protein